MITHSPIIKILCSLTLLSYSSCSLVAIRDLVQFNLAGHPVVHKTVSWPFDPDVGKRRSKQYQELNGRLGEDAIVRLGLGIDGYDQERLAQQQARDIGHLGGLNALLP